MDMTLPAPTYDLVMLLDPQADDATRARAVAEAKASIEGQGELLRHDDWGERALAYPIDRKASAQYHLMQFHVSDDQLLGGLDRTLRLADEVLRFRIVKLAPGVPPAPDMSGGPAAARRADEASDGQAEGTTGRASAPAQPTPEPVRAQAESPPAQPTPDAAPAAESAPAESAPAESAPAEATPAAGDAAPDADAGGDAS
jgi:small subunit ribosomal protein S6